MIGHAKGCSPCRGDERQEDIVAVSSKLCFLASMGTFLCGVERRKKILAAVGWWWVAHAAALGSIEIIMNVKQILCKSEQRHRKTGLLVRLSL